MKISDLIYHVQYFQDHYGDLDIVGEDGTLLDQVIYDGKDKNVELRFKDMKKDSKDKRTKNLSLRDIHVGDWVQVWKEGPKEYTPPLKITSIHDDGNIHLVISDDGRCEPWEENIRNVDALPVTSDVLMGFGFEVKKKNWGTIVYEILYQGVFFATLFTYLYPGKPELTLKGRRCKYIHELCGLLDELGIELKLEWKGYEGDKV